MLPRVKYGGPRRNDRSSGLGRRAFGSGPERPHGTDLGESQGSDLKVEHEVVPKGGLPQAKKNKVLEKSGTTLTRSRFSPGLSDLPVALRECP